MEYLGSISENTRLVGLLGWPLEDGLSPLMYNQAFAAEGLDWVYVPLPVHPHHIEAALKGLLALNFVGVNVIAPHQQAVMRYMDEISDAARSTGAVNTIHIQDGKFYGYNSDAIGFLKGMQAAGYRPKGMKVAVLGAGGAARAAVFSLARAEAAAITVFNRTTERAAFLVDDLAESFPESRLAYEALNAETLSALSGSVDMVVNTTSVGMHPQIDACPWPDNVPIPPQSIFYDLVYTPLETRFLQQAAQAGVKTIDGLGMFIYQGVFAFETWTRHTAPLKAMRIICLERLKA